MKQAVIDFQGFQSDFSNSESNGFVIKELSIVMITGNMEQFVNTFKSPYPFYNLSRKMRNTAMFVTRNHHLLAWNDGLIPYSQLTVIIKKLCKDLDVVFFKGSEKLVIFKNLIEKNNLSIQAVYKLIPESLIKIKNISNILNSICYIPTHKFNNKSVCALRNASYYACQMRQYFWEIKRFKSFEVIKNYSKKNSSLLAANGFYLILEEHKIYCTWCFYDIVFNVEYSFEKIISEHYVNCKNNCASFNNYIPNVIDVQ